ncbi:hypothetical protein CQA57_04675 [Helicobacter anseris]|uniref:Outer membrane beta-barrel protein n=1 Tax=Helicobacter anseris TaxID=375926 RepID=A0A3D8J7W5_9HELI|nr:outer membrane beta-barrel protein [Helicobacter anseris]RDU73599.1 hypothetical protein CQA57_04675 [Helicobacter anseris]
MRKFYHAFILLACIFALPMQARFYLGVEGGYTGSNPYYDLGNSDAIFITIPTSHISGAFGKSFNGFNASFNLGTENFFNDYVGTRLDFSVGYTFLSKKFDNLKAQMNFITSGLYLDLLTNLYKTEFFEIGLFGGAGLDIFYNTKQLTEDDMEGLDSDAISEQTILDAQQFYSNAALTSRILANVAGRVGITTLIAKNHRIEILAKLPIGSINTFPFIGGGLNLANLSLNLGYRFVF